MTLKSMDISLLTMSLNMALMVSGDETVYCMQRRTSDSELSGSNSLDRYVCIILKSLDISLLTISSNMISMASGD